MKITKSFVGLVLSVLLMPCAALAATNVNQGGTGLTSVPTGSFLVGNDALRLTATSSIFIKADGSVGIGTTNPLARLQVAGTYTTDNSDVVRFNANLLSSVTASQYLFRNDGTFSPTGASVSNLYGYYFNPLLNNTAANVTSFTANYGLLQVGAAYTGTINNGYAYRAGPPSISSPNPIGTYYHFFGDAITNGNGTTTGTITNMAFRNNAPTAAAGFGGTINNYAAYFINPTGSGQGVTTNYGVRISGDGGTVTDAASTTNYALYVDSQAPSYFEKTVSLGQQVGPFPSVLWVATSSVDTSNSQIGLRGKRVGIVSGNLIGGIDAWSDDTNLTAPGVRVGAMQWVANTTHTASALGTDLTFSGTTGTTFAELMRLTGSGRLGLGTTTPFAKLSVHALNGSTATTLFAVASSTATATTTLLSVSNTGIIASNAAATSTFAKAVQSPCFTTDGTTCITGGGGGGGSGTVTYTSGSTTDSVTGIVVGAGKTITAWGKGNCVGSSNDMTVTLSMAGQVLDTAVFRTGNSSFNGAFSTMFTATPGATTTSVKLSCGDSLTNPYIIVQVY